MAEERDERGRFLPGNRAGAKENGGNGGRTTRAVAEEYQAVLRDVVTPEEFAAVIRALLCAAKKKNVSAAKLILSYILGAPPETIAVSGDVRTFIEYVNDWRAWQPDPAATTASWPTDSSSTGAPVQLAGGGAPLAKDDAGDGHSD